MTRTRRSGSLHEAAAAAPSDLAPPPYKAAMGGEDHNDNDNDDDDNDTREQRPFMSYRDEKQTELPTTRRSSSRSRVGHSPRALAGSSQRYLSTYPKAFRLLTPCTGQESDL